MIVNTRRVQGRRELSFHTLSDVLYDVDQLASARSIRTLGNWSFPKLLNHLTMTMNSSIDGFPMKAPWLVRLLVPFLKNGALKNPMRPGIKLPKANEATAFPGDESLDSALQGFRRAIARAQSERMEAPHPAFGPMTHDEWVQLHLRHAELHLSYVVRD